jgi:hypothetical protein
MSILKELNVPIYVGRFADSFIMELGWLFDNDDGRLFLLDDGVSFDFAGQVRQVGLN